MNEDKVAVLRQCCLEPLVAMSDSADSAYFLSRNREYFSNSQLFLHNHDSASDSSEMSQIKTIVHHS